MRPETDAEGLAALLDWYREMGVETAVADAPVRWLEKGDEPPGVGFRLVSADPTRAPAAPEPPPRGERDQARVTQRPSVDAAAPRTEPRAFAATPPDAAELAARSAAGEAETLDALEAALCAFDGCGLKATAKNLCFYRGASTARLMIIGEAPGREEDLEGKPFVGRAGQLLDKMLAAIGLKEADVHITNVVYWRPPGNRTPTPQETQVCRPFLERQIALVAPEILLLLGGAAAKHVLNVADGIMRIRGKWREIEIAGRRIRTMATLHPAYLLRTPAAKRQVWRDLLAVEQALKRE